MPSEVILPRVDMDMSTGKIAKWFVENGATVTKGQPLFEIETDKAAMEIEAPASGTIRDLAEVSSADIPVGSVVAWIFAEGEGTAPAAAPAPPTATEPAPMAPHKPAVVAPRPAAGATAIPPAQDGAFGKPRATPIARRLARSAGIDLASLIGSGPRGRIQAADVAGRAPQSATAAVAAPAPSALAAVPAAVPAPSLAQNPSAMAPAAVPPRPAPAAPQAKAGTLNLVALREGTGRPALLIHGFGAEAGTWRPMLAGRASERPVLALDLPGHGASPLGPIAGFADLVDAVESTLQAAGIGSIDLVGHSLGGAIAGALAARGSLDVRSLLLIAPAGLGAAINGAFVAGFLRATSEASLAPWMRELVADPSAITPAFVRATLKAREGTDLVATQQRIAEAVFPDGTQAFAIRGDLAALKIPTRLILGTADRIIPPSQAEALPGRIAIHRFPGIGHMPQIECRDEVIAIIEETSRAAK